MLERLLSPALSRWDALDDNGRAQASLVFVAAALFLVHYGWYSAWFIEDAAISFAYARNAASGEGFVSYAGGELVEGFSNPTWTILLAMLHAVGINPFIGAKLAGAVLGVVGLPYAWIWARRLLGERRDAFAAVVPLLLALSPQYVAWAASGLENSVITVLMAIGGAGMLGELQERRPLPWSGLAWGLLAITRPEAPAYAAIAGLVGFVGLVARRGFLPALDWAWRWGVLAAIPFFAWHVYAFVTFAWEAPNTYFAKLHGDDRFQPWHWSGTSARSWGYLRRYALWYGHGFLLWLYLLGLSGFKGWRARAALALSAVVYIILLPGVVWLWDVWGEAPLEGWIGALSEDGALPLWPFAKDPEWLELTRIFLFAGVGALAPVVLGLGRPRATGRLLAWWLTVFVCFFALYAGGDWMDGVRWMNLCAVPLAVLLVDAAAQAYDHLEERAGGTILPRAAVYLTLSGLASLMVLHTITLIRKPETSPYDVHQRVLYGQLVADRLDVRRPTFMDVDMGAHQWFAGPRSEIVDMAGLIDLPMGHHKWEKAFISEYVFRERQPHLAHVHGGWGRKTGIERHPRFRSDYLDIADFPVSVRKNHIGNHVRRDLVFPPDAERDPDRAVTFQTGFGLTDWEVPVPRAVPGGILTVKVWWSRIRGLPRDVRPVVFLAGDQGVVWSKELPPAYDWLPVTRWKRGEIARGTHRLTVPDSVPHGTYDLGFAVIGDRGVMQALQPPAGTVTGPPVFVRGEVRWADVVRIGPAEALEATLSEGLEAALSGEDCTDREEAWDRVRHGRAPDHAWSRRQRPRVERALAECWAERVREDLDAGIDPEALIEDAQRARWWDHRPSAVSSVTEEVAAVLRARSREAEASGDVARAYELSHDSLRLAPTWAWERRRAERLRDQRLAIHDDPSLSERVFEALGWTGTPATDVTPRP